MLQVQNTLVSLDVIESFFYCNLESCKGECCIEGDEGAPINIDEANQLSQSLNKITRYMSPEGVKAIEQNGVAYTDIEGDLVTTLINRKNCAFTCFQDGICLCAIEKAYRDKTINHNKPISCSLYPIRITEYPTFTAVNMHKWNICSDAFIKGQNMNIRVYQFLKEPLIRRFGREWYEELDLTAGIYLSEKKQIVE